MNGLEALEIISKNKPRVCASCGYTSCKDCEKVLAKAQIEKELKALEIIKKDPQRTLLISDYKDYNEYINDKDPYWIEKELMEKDEFDLLKEVLK